MTHILTRNITEWPHEEIYKKVFYNLIDDNGLTDEQIIEYVPEPWRFLLMDVKAIQQQYDAIMQMVYISAYGFLRFKVKTKKPEVNWLANTLLRMLGRRMLGICMICGVDCHRRKDTYKKLPLCRDHHIEYKNMFYDYRNITLYNGTDVFRKSKW